MLDTCNVQLSCATHAQRRAAEHRQRAPRLKDCAVSIPHTTANERNTNCVGSVCRGELGSKAVCTFSVGCSAWHGSQREPQRQARIGRRWLEARARCGTGGRSEQREQEREHKCSQHCHHNCIDSNHARHDHTFRTKRAPRATRQFCVTVESLLALQL